MLLCGLTLLIGYGNKARCAGPPFWSDGRSVIFDQIKDAQFCYSDIQLLWLGRGIDQHIFPYVHGGITPEGALFGGAVEYPVLSGVLMWLGALGADNDAQFLLLSALLLAPFALLTAWMLGRLSGWAALLWALSPPLVLYAFHNWELPVVCTAVAAFYVLAAFPQYSVRTRGIWAAVLLGIGFCLKIYPGIFVLPLLVYVATASPVRRGGQRYDLRGAMWTGLAAAGTVLLVNLPFALAGFAGWRAAFVFQQLRRVDLTTNSVWYWGARHSIDTDGVVFQRVVSLLSLLLIGVCFAVAMWWGTRQFCSTGTFPLIGVSGAMLCGFLLFHKVHSPQYTLWLIPFLVLLAVPWPIIGAYLLADAVLGIGIFRYFYALSTGGSVEITQAVVQFGVWGRALGLVVLFFVFLRAPVRGLSL